MTQDTSLLRNYEGPVNALVAGATGGIGMALVNQLAAHQQVAHLFALARAATTSPALEALANAHPGRVHLLDCDLTQDAALAETAAAVGRIVSGLHLTINTVGMLHAPGLQPEKALAQITLSGMQTLFLINAFAPILLAKALLPFMRHCAPAVFVSLSARVGSIGDNRAGGWYSYRGAKAAQNQFLKTLSIELARLNHRSIVLALHPGTTDTRLSKPFQTNVRSENLLTPEFSAASLLSVIAERTPADTGGFYAWNGQGIVW